MFQSTSHLISGKNNKAKLKKYREYYRQLRKNCSGKKGMRRPHVRSYMFNRKKVFLDRFNAKFNTLRKDNIARRIVFLPCVVDLLRNSKDEPYKKNKNYILSGMAPNGQVFRLIIRKDKNGFYVFNFYPK
jgi:hypothetical protein